MYIEEFITPAMACSGVSIGSVVRKENVLLCISDDVDIERILIEFDDEETALDFECALENDSARIVIEKDISIDAAPDELRSEYLLCLAAENQERLEELRTELWDDYGIDPDNDEPLKTSGIKRIAVMHDTGVSAYGFVGMETDLRKWMMAHGFPVTDWNLRIC